MVPMLKDPVGWEQGQGKHTHTHTLSFAPLGLDAISPFGYKIVFQPQQLETVMGYQSMASLYVCLKHFKSTTVM